MTGCLKYEQQTDEILESLSDIEKLCRARIDRTGNIPHQLCLLADRLSQCYNDTESPYISCVTYAAPAGRTLLKDWYADAVWMPFVNVQVPVPIGYDSILTAIYGDYMTPMHGTVAHTYPFYKIQIEKYQT